MPIQAPRRRRWVPRPRPYDTTTNYNNYNGYNNYDAYIKYDNDDHYNRCRTHYNRCSTQYYTILY